MSTRARETVSAKIDHLFGTVRRPDGREYTYDDVERGTSGRVSRSYVWKLRHGRNSNPSLDVLEALSEFFGVPPSYFFGPQLEDDRRARDSAEVAALLRDPSARLVAQQARGLGAGALDALADMIQHLRRMDGGAPLNGHKRAVDG